jgi:hypothetical protein
MKDFQQRVVDEKSELDGKVEKLTAFLNGTVAHAEQQSRGLALVAELRELLGEEAFTLLEPNLAALDADQIGKVVELAKDAQAKVESLGVREIPAKSFGDIASFSKKLLGVDIAPPKRFSTSKTIHNAAPRTGRNADCPHHPGVKFKKCKCSKLPVSINHKITRKAVA